MKRYASPALFIAAVVLANWMTSHYGRVDVGFGLLVTAGTFAAGVALTARDLVQDAWERRGIPAAIVCIAAGGLLSWWLSTPSLAVASVTAFAVAELADLGVYTPLRARSWQAAVWASLLVGALIDSVLFLHLAGFGVTTAGIVGQLLGKAYATVPFSTWHAWRERGALHGEPVDPVSA